MRLAAAALGCAEMRFSKPMTFDVAAVERRVGAR
jgi:hypothetical protein